MTVSVLEAENVIAEVQSVFSRWFGARRMFTTF